MVELIVAMAITTIIVTVLVSITSIAIETWNRSRSELRASRMGKLLLDYMARDFETLVARRGNSAEWLSAAAIPVIAGSTLESTGASRLIFFTAATDRYDGNAGSPTLDRGGDACCAAYLLDYKRPILMGTNQFRTFVLNRMLMNPDETFTKLLGTTSVQKPLDTAFTTIYSDAVISQPPNYTCENVYQYTVTFLVQVVDSSVTPPVTRTVRVPVGGSGATKFRLLGSGIITDYAGPDKELVAAGRAIAMEISATVLSDFAMEQIQQGRRPFNTDEDKSKFLAKNSYSFTKVVQLPSM